MHNQRNNSIGLDNDSYTQLLFILTNYKKIAKAWVFGSRVKGYYSQVSDLDLCVCGDDLSIQDKGNLLELFELSSIPPRVDLVFLEEIGNGSIFHQEVHDAKIEIYDRKNLIKSLLIETDDLLNEVLIGRVRFQSRLQGHNYLAY